ncbi:MAG: lytic transglycosylase domain-containing protein [Alphaproteobacteria bacterium]|nr:lytic transglycosylase domain-containing protein [Alphaproteobacteria bacterium]
MALLCLASAAYAERPDTYDKLIAAHAAANGVPESLVHRVIVRESRYNPRLIGRCGCLGLMQIKLGTARSLGYGGTAQGLLDPETNLTYGVKYLAGAYRVAGGNADRAVAYYARGYYYAAKQQHLAMQVTSDVRPASQAAEGILSLPEENRTENEKKPVRATRTAAMSRAR